MKSKIYILLFFAFAVLSCSKSDNSVIGEWRVNKVNFEFDERKSTPEMIRQFGDQEQHNVLNFKNDSIVYIKMAQIDGDYYYTIDEKGIIKYCADGTMSDSEELGRLEKGVIISKMSTVIGEMTVIYKSL